MTPKMGHKEGFSEIKVIPNSVYLMNPPKFIAGNVTHFLPNWVAITEDLHILKLIAEGVTLDFHTPPPTQNRYSTWSHPYSPAQEKTLSLEMQRLQKKGVIVPTQLKPCSFVSPIFTTEKRDHSLRLILNLKTLNTYVRHIHFKMESLKDVLHMLSPGAWMASIDLRDAHYTIPVHLEYRKYFTCLLGRQYFEFTCLPNGYAQAPLIFTKILKLPLTYLRKLGHAWYILMTLIYKATLLVIVQTISSTQCTYCRALGLLFTPKSRS